MHAQAASVKDVPAEAEGEGALASLEVIYREYHDFVWRNARRLGCDAGTVDDVVHEVFLVVARRLSEFRGEARLRSWLFAITYHVVQRLRRDRVRYAKRLDAYGNTRNMVPPQADSCAQEAGHQLRQLLLRLSEPKRLVFIMAELEGMTSAEIALCLETKQGTVDSRLRAARLDLKSLIEHDHAQARRFR